MTRKNGTGSQQEERACKIANLALDTETVDDLIAQLIANKGALTVGDVIGAIFERTEPEGAISAIPEYAAPPGSVMCPFL